MLLPNISPPVDRREKTRQLHVKHRGPEQASDFALKAAWTKEELCKNCCDGANWLGPPLLGPALMQCERMGCHC